LTDLLNRIKQGLLATAFIGFSTLSTSAIAVPTLQLGSSGSGWNYDSTDQTWVTTDENFTLAAYANATDGGGSYAWEDLGTSQTAYLVVAAAPKTDKFDGDVFDVTVNNDGGALSLLTSGWGNPPLEDQDSLSPHGIYNTYFEIYAFNFDGLSQTIYDTQPGTTGSGNGFEEIFDISINSMASTISGIHMDLFTTSGNGSYDPLIQELDRFLVQSFAPLSSHDAEATPTSEVPVPATFLLFGLGLLGIAASKYRKA